MTRADIDAHDCCKEIMQLARAEQIKTISLLVNKLVEVDNENERLLSELQKFRMEERERQPDIYEVEIVHQN